MQSANHNITHRLLLGREHVGTVFVELSLVGPHPDILPHAIPRIGSENRSHNTESQKSGSALQCVLVDLCSIEKSEKPIQAVFSLPGVLLPLSDPFRFISAHFLK